MNRGQKEAQSITKWRAASAYAGFKRLIHFSFSKIIQKLHVCLFTDVAKPDCPAGTIIDSIIEASPLIPMRRHR